MSTENLVNTDAMAETDLARQPRDEGRPQGLYGLSWATKGKIAASVGMDGVDLAIGWVPGVGHAWELIAITICCAMWGKAGAWSALELVDVTNAIDSFVPICSIIAWYCVRQELAAR